jgi:Tol biopolymer transport system component
MMRKLFLSLIFVPLIANSQLPDTDIYLCSVSKSDSGYSFTTPVNITDHEGYDNQPYFTPDGKRILYVSVEDSLQSDIYAYDLAAGVRIQMTNTPESEYSPAYSADRRFLTAVRVDADSGQRFYLMPLSDLYKSAEVYNSDSIGYGCILNDSMLAMFILGRSNTLQLLNMKNSKRKLIASDIGRCMKLSNDGTHMYFVVKGNPTEWFIYSMDCKTYALQRMIQTLPACEDFALLPDGNLFMGKEGKLYSSYQSTEWKMIADFTGSLSDFYRIAINANGTMMALVVYSGKKP